MKVSLRGFTDHIAHLAVSPSNAVIAVSTDDVNSRDYLIRVWSLRDGSATGILHGHRADINHIVFDPATHLLVSASDDGSLRVWDVEGTYLTRTQISGTDMTASEERGADAGVDASDEDMLTAHRPESDGPVAAPPPISSRLSRSVAGRSTATSGTTGTSARGSAVASHASQQNIAPPRNRDASAAAPPAAVLDGPGLQQPHPMVSSLTAESARCRVVTVQKSSAGRASAAASSTEAVKLQRLAVSPTGGIVAVGGDDGIVRIFKIAEPTADASKAAEAAASADAISWGVNGGRGTRGAGLRRGGAAVVMCLDSDSDDAANTTAAPLLRPGTVASIELDAGTEQGPVDIGSAPLWQVGADGSGGAAAQPLPLPAATTSLSNVWVPLETPRLIAELAGHSREVTDLHFNSTGTVLASVAHEEGRANLWRWTPGMSSYRGVR